ncbi:4'-phosphopantetheinyl transferase family protein [Dyadobacter subterraneus]|uniref:4'-phosphopantetheinyl transferase superfamily protein n=1 Tax=Dyadobacter subterraneus TaxID=2773304 RepID=A0ABR9WG88_9BACT|nr:4'-phosphopantetheinyl transferase superfamily protein [Dyadobacter subterraneus]MBE9464139.1 4'-phosphopantetheinyl transferase superfamily protein [Dyadobacter subterraneus]
MGLVYKKILNGRSILGLWEISESLEELMLQLKPSDFELEKLDKKINNKRKSESLAVRLLLDQLLEGKPEISYDENGKPFLNSTDYEISISHSEKYAAVYLVKGKSAGVDIQKIKADIGKGIDFFLNDDEQLWVDKTDFILINILWSAKESVYKFAGIKDLDPRNHMSVNPFLAKPDGEITVSFGQEKRETISIQYEVFEDYVLTRTL